MLNALPIPRRLNLLKSNTHHYTFLQLKTVYFCTSLQAQNVDLRKYQCLKLKIHILRAINRFYTGATRTFVLSVSLQCHGKNSWSEKIGWFVKRPTRALCSPLRVFVMQMTKAGRQCLDPSSFRLQVCKKFKIHGHIPFLWFPRRRICNGITRPQFQWIACVLHWHFCQIRPVSQRNPTHYHEPLSSLGRRLGNVGSFP